MIFICLFLLIYQCFVSLTLFLMIGCWWNEFLVFQYILDTKCCLLSSIFFLLNSFFNIDKRVIFEVILVCPFLSYFSIVGFSLPCLRQFLFIISLRKWDEGKNIFNHHQFSFKMNVVLQFLDHSNRVDTNTLEQRQLWNSMYIVSIQKK